MDESQLRELGLTDFMINQIKTGDLDAPLGFRCQPPFHWTSSPIAEREIIPLWECGITFWYFDLKSRVFEECSLESIDEPFHRYTSFQSVLAELFLDLYEDEIELPQLRELARKADFRHVDQMLSDLSGSIEDYSSWREQFPLSCT